MTSTRTTMNKETVCLEFGGNPHCLKGILQTLGVTTRIAACKATGPMEAGNTEARFRQQIEPPDFTKIG
jgi:hypothetical protein